MLYGSDESKGAVIIRCCSILLSQMWKFGDILLEGVMKNTFGKIFPCQTVQSRMDHSHSSSF